MVRKTFIVGTLALASLAWAQDSSLVSALELASTASPAEMRDGAAASVVTVKSNAKAVGKLTEAARAKGDIKAQSCLTTKNVAAQALVQVTEAANSSLGTLLASNEADKARHEYRKIVVSTEKSNAKLAEANQCVEGGGEGTSGRTAFSGGVGDDNDTVDTDQLDELDILLDASSVSTFLP